jgi:hypothetical protein
MLLNIDFIKSGTLQGFGSEKKYHALTLVSVFLLVKDSMKPLTKFEPIAPKYNNQSSKYNG